MATILLQAAGAALGSVFGPVGAIAGRAIGAMAGATLDQALFSPSGPSPSHLSTARLSGPEEGAPIPRLYGTARIGGTLIWATRFLETVTEERAGGKGTRRVDHYAYSVSFALGLCEGPIAGLRRIWADGRELPLSGIEYRVHTGTMDQMPDPLIEAKQGVGQAPAFRGLAYVVFENLPLTDFGNRIPLLQFEVMRPVGALENQIRAVTLIPGATEHGYDPEVVTEKTGSGEARRLNGNSRTGKSDWELSLDELQALCPNLDSVALVTSWFGSDLRVDACRIEPGVEVSARGESRAWTVSGTTRSTARLVSRVNGSPAYGGTPNDASVIDAIRDLKARGLKVFLYPFLLMDIAPGNTLPDPYSTGHQAAFPWRGRITCDPAPGLAGSPDGTAAIDAQVASFFGNAARSDFTVSGSTITYTGPEKSYRRMILHHALLAEAAGGVDGFIIGSELRGLTTLSSARGRYPAVTRLKQLAEAVRAILGSGPAITYAADWSEYFGHQPQDGSGDVWFHLDELWASSAISAVGIDNYLPLADFRDRDFSTAHPDGFRHQDDPAGLETQITSGERFDWYYASDADRAAGRRTPITDGAAGKRWVFAPKDIEGWWANRHHNRLGGVEQAAPTGWLPRMKPVFFTELGCPAIDRGANQPNVFLDPKSSESFAPFFSRRYRADSVQRRFLEAHYRHWAGPSAPSGMVAPGNIFVWCWDARPFPAFPQADEVWSDGANWQTGHWLNGRLGAGTVADILAAILRDHGFSDFDVSCVTGDLIGYVKGEAGSARGLIQPLLDAFQIDVIEDADRLRFVSRMEASLPAKALPVLADVEGEPLAREQRNAATEMPAAVLIGFNDPQMDYEPGTARARRESVMTQPLQQFFLPGVADQRQMTRQAETVLREACIGSRGIVFRLSPTQMELQPGDVVTLPDGPAGTFLVVRIEDGAERLVEARAFAAPAATLNSTAASPRKPRMPVSASFAPELAFLDLPRLSEGSPGSFARVAALAKPWRGMALSVSPGSEDFVFRQIIDRPARLGTLAAPLPPGTVEGRFDGERSILTDLGFGALSSASRLAVLQGANRIAVQSASGIWEVLGFARAEELMPGRFALSQLLCGLYGTGDAMRAGAPAGARLILLDEAVQPVGLGSEDLGLSRNYLVEALGHESGRAGPFAFASGLRAETPLAPVRLSARRLTNGAIELSWIRRGRIDADSWEASEIPLDEDSQSYRVELLAADGHTLRTWTAGDTTVTYSGAEEIADFGTRQTELTFRVRQIGRRVPLGLATTATARI